MTLTGQRYSVLGLARSGLAAANALAERGADVVASDLRTSEALSDYLAQLHPAVDVRLGGNHYRPGDVVIVSPGLKPHHPIFTEMRNTGCEVIGEVELFVRLKRPTTPILAVTGTDGKSTTTSWLGTIVSADRNCWVGGNIGIALCAGLEHITDHTVVAEISNAQLISTPSFHPNVAVVTNIAPDHLDYHGGFDGYVAAKRHILTHLTNEDAAVLNATDPIIQTWNAPRVVWFGQKYGDEYVAITENTLSACVGDFDGPIIDIRELQLPGPHNAQNAMAATAAALAHGISIHAIQTGLRNFSGLAHRLEFVREHDGVRYYNDSKATNPHASMAGLKAFEGQRLVAIAGGSEKNADFSDWAELASQTCHHMVLCGTTATRLADALGGRVPITMADTLEDALKAANGVVRNDGVVVLSPACASFDQFENFEHRGDVFRQLVQSLTSNA